jgi:Protein of unknown function (DUF3429)
MDKTVPAGAARLAYLGLLPFMGGMLLAWLLPAGGADTLEAHAFVMRGLSVYAATVIAFLGALHWGAAMQRGDTHTRVYASAVMPSLAAWVAALMPAYAGLVLHGVLLLACYAVDRGRYPGWGLQRWLTLRFRCTLGASLSCFLAAAAT